MAQLQTQAIPREKFLMLSVNLLHRAFIESARTDAKNMFRQVAGGHAVHLSTVEMEDKLNYGAFRASLASLIANISQALRDKKEFSVFNAQQDADTMIFGITAVTVEQDTPNVMVLGADLDGQSGATTLRLMYLDPEQFAEGQA